METKICIYCGRTLDVNLLIDKAGKYRCKDEHNCLDYQTGEDPASSIENADYVSGVVKSALAEAAQRITVYKGRMDDRKTGGGGDLVDSTEESINEFAWMKTVMDALAIEYQNNQKFVFQFAETEKNEYVISFYDEDRRSCFTVKIDCGNGSRYALTVTKDDRVPEADILYKEFIYKSYPSSRREDVIMDLSVILIVLEKEKDMIPALLYKFRSEIESRYYRCDEAPGG